MSLTAAEKRAYAANATGARVIEGMTLTHPRFTAPFHLTAERAGFAGGDGDGGTIVYTPAPVHATQPGQDESGLGRRSPRSGPWRCRS